MSASSTASQSSSSKATLTRLRLPQLLRRVGRALEGASHVIGSNAKSSSSGFRVVWVVVVWGV